MTTLSPAGLVAKMNTGAEKRWVPVGAGVQPAVAWRPR